jgi:hypothetical protein
MKRPSLNGVAIVLCVIAIAVAGWRLRFDRLPVEPMEGGAYAGRVPIPSACATIRGARAVLEDRVLTVDLECRMANSVEFTSETKYDRVSAPAASADITSVRTVKFLREGRDSELSVAISR